MAAGTSAAAQGSGTSFPRDVAAIFHVSFHPTKGNTVDWCFTAPGWDDLPYDTLGLEFSALPSGLHQVDEDIVYFTTCLKSSQPTLLHAISLFRRRRTSNPTYRGFLLSALGVLVVPSYPNGSTITEGNGMKKHRPWRHVESLKEVAGRCYSRPGSDPSATPITGKLVDVDNSQEEWYTPALTFLDECGVASLSLQDYLSSGPDPAANDELTQLDDLRSEVGFCKEEHIPALQLPGLLSLLGPSSITLFKHLLARKRIMVYTNVPVGPACAMCYALVDIVQSVQSEGQPSSEDVTIPPRHTGPIRVLGMLTLNDLVNESKRGILEDKVEEGRGWVACTTDALFLEKPQYYDLLVDLTALSAYSSLSSSSPASTIYPSASATAAGPPIALDGNGKRPSNFASNRPRPTFYVSKVTTSTSSSSSRPLYKLSLTRWAWSDVRIWSEVDRILRTTQDVEASKSTLSSSAFDSPAAAPLHTSASSRSTSSSGSAKPKKQKAKSKSRERGRDRRGSQSASATPSANAGFERPQSPNPLNRIPTTIPTSLADAWKVYEDVCLVCAGAWMGALCARAGSSGSGPVHSPRPGSDTPQCVHGPNSSAAPCCTPPAPKEPLVVPSGANNAANSAASGRQGKSTAVQLEGEDDILLRTVRGGKMREVSTSSYATVDTTASGKTLVAGDETTSKAAEGATSQAAVHSEELSTTLALLYTLDRYATWQIGVLRAYVKSLVAHYESVGGGEEGGKLTLTLSPRDLVLLDLNPLSTGDVRYLEALLKEYAGHVVVQVQVEAEREAGVDEDGSGEGVQLQRERSGQRRDMNIDLVVKRGWRELIAVVLGLV